MKDDECEVEVGENMAINSGKRGSHLLAINIVAKMAGSAGDSDGDDRRRRMYDGDDAAAAADGASAVSMFSLGLPSHSCHLHHTFNSSDPINKIIRRRDRDFT
jgi:hypothetical protein